MVVIEDSNNATLYVNGSVEATFTTTLRPINGESINIGRAEDLEGDGVFRLFSGHLDDWAVYEIALTTTDIQRHIRGFAPVLHLPLDEPSIAQFGIVVDESNFNNNVYFALGFDEASYAVQAINGVGLKPAVGSGAYAFDGIDDIMFVPERPHLDLSDGEFTQMAWVNIPAGGGGSVIGGVFSFETIGQSYPSLTVSPNGINVEFGDGVDLNSYYLPHTLTTDTWHFVATTYDGSFYSIYVDGVLVGVSPDSGGMKPYPTQKFFVGGISCGNSCSSYFKGAIDNVAVYRQVLSADQIAEYYHMEWQETALSASGSGVNETEWSYEMPAGLEGSYRIQLRTTDSNNNISFGDQDNGDWAGHIGLAPPALTVVGNNLTWTNTDTSCGWEIHRSLTPYFTPNAGTLVTSLPNGTLTYDISAYIVDTTEQDYLRVLPTGCTSPGSQEKGIHHQFIAPGS
jgi:hypothetical protein